MTNADEYIKEDTIELKAAYEDIGNGVYWKTKLGEEKRVAEMSTLEIVRCLDMLDIENPKSFWFTIFENELVDRNYNDTI